MEDAVIAGAVAGAVAGAIAAIAISLSMRRSNGGWRAFTTGAPQPWRSRGAMTQTHAPVPFRSFSFDALDASGKRVMAVAQDEAIRNNHNYIGTEHLLLGLIRGDAGGPAGRALARAGVTLDRARSALDFIVPRGDASTGPAEITLSPRTRKVLELALAEATARGKDKAGAAEILLGLLREGQGIASGIIESLGTTLEAMRQGVLTEMSAGSHGSSATSSTNQARAYHGPFDRFNDRAKRALALAQDEAVRFNHNYIGPEHLLLGLIREGEGVAGRALHAAGIELSRARQALENVIGRGEVPVASEITLTPRTKMVIEFAIDESAKLGRQDVRTEDLLLGIIRDDGSIACNMLREQGASTDKVRQYVMSMVETRGEPPPSATSDD